MLISHYDRSFRWPAGRAAEAVCAEQYIHSFAVEGAGSGPDAGSAGPLWRRIRSTAARPTSHRPPEWACWCGLYAALDVDRAVEVAQRNRGSRCVIGVVAGWGRVLVHEHGWRSQFATPAALLQCWALSPLQRRLVRRAADRYGVPVLTVRAELEDYWGDLQLHWPTPVDG